MNAMTETSPTSGETVSVSNADLAEAVRQSAMLADVSVSTFTFERTDKSIMEKVKADAGASGDVGRVVKKLLAGADTKLKDVLSAFNAVRTTHYQLTLPWVSDPHAPRQTGPRLLPNLLFEKYLGELSRLKREAMAKLDEFLADYDQYIQQAKGNLGALVNTDEYPSEQEVREKFRINFDFEPLPSGAQFRGLPEHMLSRLSKGLSAKQDRMIAAAQAEMWSRVREGVQHLVERLKAYDEREDGAGRKGMFKNTTVENVRELIALIPGFNITGDARAQEIQADIEEMLAGVTVGDLRKDATTRGEVTGKAQAIADKLSKWGL